MFIEYAQARNVGRAVGELVVTAEKHFNSGNYQTAVYMATAVLEEMTEALEFADDSNGDIGGCIEPAVEILFSICKKQLNEALRKELFIYCLTTFQKELFKGWDWHFSLLDMATQLAQTAHEEKQICILLEAIKPNNTRWDWDLKSAQQIRLQLIRKTEGEAKAELYMAENLDNPDFRKGMIEKAISGKDYTQAIVLSEEGIKKDEKEFPGLACDWRDYLLNIYTHLNKADEVIRYARYQFLNANRDKKRYFDILKKQVPTENWSNFVQELINNIRKRNHWLDSDSIAQIYIWEERWKDLLEWLKQHTSLNALEKFETYLSEAYSEELISLYQAAILKYMEKNVSRSHYQEACRYLRRMIKLGGSDKAMEVKKMLQTLYPTRRALMEELQKV
jgi:hypothetical protein